MSKKKLLREKWVMEKLKDSKYSVNIIEMVRDESSHTIAIVWMD